MVPETDVALLRVDGQRTAPCLALDTATPKAGADVYAVGDPPPSLAPTDDANSEPATGAFPQRLFVLRD